MKGLEGQEEIIPAPLPLTLICYLLFHPNMAQYSVMLVSISD